MNASVAERMDFHEYIRVCNRLSVEEILLLLEQDGTWALPPFARDPARRMEAARAVAMEIVATWDGIMVEKKQLAAVA